MSTGPVEAKVRAATGGAGLGTAAAAALVWLLSETAFDGNPVPWEVETFVYAVMLIGLPTLLTFAAGYQARHTPRTDPDARLAEVTDLADRDARRVDPET